MCFASDHDGKGHGGPTPQARLRAFFEERVGQVLTPADLATVGWISNPSVLHTDVVA